jgi:ubiquinone/menaquinone biosynthesis C-methylase UbiE
MIKNKRIASHWGKTAPEEAVNIFNFYPIKKYFYERITNEKYYETSDLTEWTVRKYIGECNLSKNVLSLGCGFGFLERKLAELKVFNHCTAIDISSGAIEKAKEIAKDKGINNIDYIVGDLEKISLDEEKYDIVWMNGSLHHISDLKRSLIKIERSLKPGGIFINNDFIGPDYQQLSIRHRELINSIIHLIPPDLRSLNENNFVPSFYRHSIFRRFIYELYRILFFKPGYIDIDGLQQKPKLNKTTQKLYDYYLKIKKNQTFHQNKFKYGKVWDNDPYYYIIKDPSECVRSSEIIPNIKEIFKKSNIHYYNGSLLAYCIDPKFIKKYNEENSMHKELLSLIISIEEILIEMNEIEPNFAHIISFK